MMPFKKKAIVEAELYDDDNVENPVVKRARELNELRRPEQPDFRSAPPRPKVMPGPPVAPMSRPPVRVQAPTPPPPLPPLPSFEEEESYEEEPAPMPQPAPAAAPSPSPVDSGERTIISFVRRSDGAIDIILNEEEKMEAIYGTLKVFVLTLEKLFIEHYEDKLRGDTKE